MVDVTDTTIEEPKDIGFVEPEVQPLPVPSVSVPGISVMDSTAARDATEANKLFVEEQEKKMAATGLENFQTSGTEGLFKTPTGEFRIIADPNIAANAKMIADQGLTFVRGTDVSPQVGEQFKLAGLSTEERKALGIEDAGIDISPEEEQLQLSFETLNSELQDTSDELNTLRATFSDIGKGIIDDIKATFEIRKRKMQDTNKRSLAQLQQIGFRLGTARFSPLTATGIVSFEEKEGIQRLADLDAQEKRLINEAKLAITKQDFELLQEKRNNIEDVLEKKEKALQDLQEITAKKDKEVDDRKKEIEIDSVVSEAIKLGQTDINSIFDILARAGVDVTSEELANSFSNLTEGLDEELGTGSIGQFRQAQAEDIIPEDMTYFEFLARESLAKKTVSGDGQRSVNDLTGFERLAAANLAVEIFGKRAGTKPENRGLVENLMAGGMSIDDIQDELRFTFQSDAFDGAIRTASENITIGLSSGKAEVFTNALDRHVANEDFEQAKETLVRGVEESLDAADRKIFKGNRRAVEIFDEIEGDLKEYEALGGNTGIFNGKIEKLANRVGLIRDPALAEIANKIAIAIQRYRHDVSGAAFTESEAVEYRGIFPDIDKISALNSAKINSAREVLRGDVDSVLRHAMGSTAYDEIFDGESESSPTVGSMKDGDSVQSENDEDIDAYLNSLDNLGK